MIYPPKQQQFSHAIDRIYHTVGQVAQPEEYICRTFRKIGGFLNSIHSVKRIIELLLQLIQFYSVRRAGVQFHMKSIVQFNNNVVFFLSIELLRKFREIEGLEGLL